MDTKEADLMNWIWTAEGQTLIILIWFMQMFISIEWLYIHIEKQLKIDQEMKDCI